VVLIMSLPEQGFRFLVRPDRNDGAWVHPAEVSAEQYSGWTDCTDTTDEEFDEFMMWKRG
jgi:hypothetical protein